jgi:hypothetical protein
VYSMKHVLDLRSTLLCAFENNAIFSSVMGGKASINISACVKRVMQENHLNNRSPECMMKV